ncbi:MAG: PIN domain-containing protein [Bilifractor sp.]
MKRGFLIDLENVQSAGLDGVDQLTDEDIVIVFYSNKADNLKIDMVKTIQESSAKVVYLKVFNGTPNALDFQLLTYLYYYYNPDDEDAQYWIISRDTGYDASITMSRKLGANNIRRAPAIKNAVHYKLKSDKIASIRRERKRAELREEIAENDHPEGADDTAESEALENDEIFDGSVEHEMEEASDAEVSESAEAEALENAVAEADHAEESENSGEFDHEKESEAVEEGTVESGIASENTEKDDAAAESIEESDVVTESAEGTAAAKNIEEESDTVAENEEYADRTTDKAPESDEIFDGAVENENTDGSDHTAEAAVDADSAVSDGVPADEAAADADSHEHEKTGRRRRPRRRSRRKTPRTAETEEAKADTDKTEASTEEHVIPEGAMQRAEGVKKADDAHEAEAVQKTENVHQAEVLQKTENVHQPEAVQKTEKVYQAETSQIVENLSDHTEAETEKGKVMQGTASAARREIPVNLREFLSQNVEIPFDDRTMSVIVLGLEQCEKRGEFYQFFRRHLGGKHGAEVYRNVKNHLGEMREMLQ